MKVRFEKVDTPGMFYWAVYADYNDRSSSKTIFYDAEARKIVKLVKGTFGEENIDVKVSSESGAWWITIRFYKEEDEAHFLLWSSDGVEI